jgi:TonB family protein
MRCLPRVFRILVVAAVSLSQAFAVVQRPLEPARIRVALVGLGQPLTDQTLASALREDPRIGLVDSALTDMALRGFGYDGSINMTTEQARRLGAAIGCDFFVVGKSEVLLRSERRGESHHEAYAGIMIVDARSGKLALFEFLDEKAESRDAASAALAKKLRNAAGDYGGRLASYRTGSLVIGASNAVEPVEELPDEESPRAEGFKPPEFLNRVKPEYTSEAELADITATVEASVVFQADGKIGGVEIVRWAGFGLDESARRAIAKLRFKPATRDGRPISVRANVQYNFRRLDDATPRQQASR